MQPLAGLDPNLALARIRQATVIVDDDQGTTDLVNATATTTDGVHSIVSPAQTPIRMDAARSVVLTLSENSGATMTGIVEIIGKGQFFESITETYLLVGDQVLETSEVFWQIDTITATVSSAAASDSLSVGKGGHIGLGIDIRDIRDVFAVTLEGVNETVDSPLDATFDWFDPPGAETGTWSIWAKYE